MLHKPFSKTLIGHMGSRSFGLCNPVSVDDLELRPMKKCSLCDSEATIFFKQTNVCELHYRFKQMRYDAQASGKTVPPAGEIERLLYEMRDSGMVCPCCLRRMNWHRSGGHSTIVSLQHDHSGAFRLICLGCNVKHQHVPNDGFYSIPPTHKYCRRCKTVLPLTDYYPKREYASGVCSWCKKCSIKDAVLGMRRRRANARH